MQLVRVRDGVGVVRTVDADDPCSEFLVIPRCGLYRVGYMAGVDVDTGDWVGGIPLPSKEDAA